MKRQEKERNYNIDFLRGIATLCIILIHTAFWSGEQYLPAWFKNLTLLVDVPVFMFISGITFNFSNSITKTIKNIISMWKKWLYFILYYIILILIFYRDTFHLKDIISWSVFTFEENSKIPVVGGSTWFIPMYITVSIICSIIICAVNNYKKEDKIKTFINIELLIFLLFVSATIKEYFFLFNETIWFYSFVFILGYIINEHKIKGIKQLLLYELINIIIIFIVFNIFDVGIVNIQGIKFPPSIPYFFFSMISIILFWYMKDHLKIKKSNIINYIGRNAIFFYYAQGVISSLMYNLYNVISNNNIIIVFVVLLVTNILGTTVFAVFLEKTYNLIFTRERNNNVIKNIIVPQKNK